MPKPQREACTALNLTAVHRFRRVILPQALPLMIPPAGNLVVQLIKSTPLMFLVGVVDLFTVGDMMRQGQPGSVALVYLGLLVVFFLLSMIVVGITQLLENWAKRRLGQKPVRISTATVAGASARGGGRMTWDNAVRAGDLADVCSTPSCSYTLVITVLATLLAAVLGLVMAVIRYSKVPVLSPVTTGFLQFIRATPIPVQLFFVYYVLPDMGVLIGAVTTGVLVLGVHYASYFAEVYRGGIESIPKGQWEACTALSLPSEDVWQRVVLPQAVRKILPSLGNYVISMFKEVPFLLFISVPEMVAHGQGHRRGHFRYLEPFTICGIYLPARQLPRLRCNEETGDPP